jgi:hypothetical protein
MVTRTSRAWSAAIGAALFAAGFGVRGFVEREVAHAQGATRVFEMRTYTAAPGKFTALQSRFRDHTLRIFEKHGMQNIGYWIPADGPNSENTIVYILAHKDRETAKKSWAAFGADPEWQKVRTASMAPDGASLTTKVESVFLNPTDYSPMK